MYIIQEKYETAHPRRLKTSKSKTDFFSAPISDFAAHLYGARGIVLVFSFGDQMGDPEPPPKLPRFKPTFFDDFGQIHDHLPKSSLVEETRFL